MIKKFLNSGFFLLLILLFAIFLRVYNIPQTLLFHFDQGYHGLAIREIWESKRIALLGHKTDVEGIFHGSFFYYLMLPIYLVAGWNPAGVSTFLAVLDSFTVIFIYLIGKDLFDKKVGLLAATFYAVSYALTSYSRWLSNVTPIPFFSALFFYFLLKSYQGKISFFPSACLVVGIIAQLNGAIGFFFLPVWFISFLIFWQKIWQRKKIVLVSVFLFLLPALPLILFDLRHNFLISGSIVRLFFKERGLSFSFPQIITHFDLLRSEFISLLTYKLPAIGLILLLVVLIAIGHSGLTKQSSWKQVKISLFFLLVPVLGLLFYPGGIHQFFFIGILPLLILLLSWSLVYWWQKRLFRPAVVVLVLVLVIINLFHWRGFLKPGFNLIPIGTRNLITLEDRLRAADFIYQRAQGQPFQTPIYIIPYNQEQPWDYVFNWYGKKKYGYLPSKYFGQTFTIYEPDYDYPYRLESWLGKIKEDHGGVVAEFKAHDLTVQERER